MADSEDNFFEDDEPLTQEEDLDQQEEEEKEEQHQVQRPAVARSDPEEVIVLDSDEENEQEGGDDDEDVENVESTNVEDHEENEDEDDAQYVSDQTQEASEQSEADPASAITIDDEDDEVEEVEGDDGDLDEAQQDSQSSPYVFNLPSITHTISDESEPAGSGSGPGGVGEAGSDVSLFGDHSLTIAVESPSSGQLSHPLTSTAQSAPAQFQDSEVMTAPAPTMREITPTPAIQVSHTDRKSAKPEKPASRAASPVRSPSPMKVSSPVKPIESPSSSTVPKATHGLPQREQEHQHPPQQQQQQIEDRMDISEVEMDANAMATAEEIINSALMGSSSSASGLGTGSTRLSSPSRGTGAPAGMDLDSPFVSSTPKPTASGSVGPSPRQHESILFGGAGSTLAPSESIAG
ncbi:hypothetical protein HDU76_000357, partial [Blyttiomyces sp. JEL0837]